MMRNRDKFGSGVAFRRCRCWPAYQILPANAQTADSGLLGDMGGLRTILGDEGVTLGITDSENLLANVAGGVKQGATCRA